jgi:hypothetical protein
MANNINTNFYGPSNLPSSTALHNVTVQANTFTSVAGTAAPDIIFPQALEGGVMITDFSINANTPLLVDGNWNLVARNPNNTGVTAVADVVIGSFTDGTATVATNAGLFTKLSAANSNNIRLVLTPATAGTNYNVAANFTLTLYVTYMNSH